MHKVTINRPLTWGPLTLNPGAYLAEDHNTAEILWAGGGFGDVSAECVRDYPEQNIPVDLESLRESITVVRVGGFGDLLWLNAIYQEIKARHPGIEIRHSCFPRYAPVLEGFVDEVLPYPLPLNSCEISSRFYWLENIIEAKPCLEGEHPCDRMAKAFGLEPLEKKAAYHVTPREHKRARSRWPRRPGVARVAVQVESSTGNKSYPHIPAVIDMLAGAGVEVCVVGDPSPQDGQAPRNVFNCRKVSLGIRASIAMVAQCDAIVGADSVMHHVGVALGIPVVGIFGPFDGATYLAGAPPHSIVIQGRRSCSPCSWHPRGAEYPPGEPCGMARRCVALADIHPREVVAQVGNVLEAAGAFSNSRQPQLTSN